MWRAHTQKHTEKCWLVKALYFSAGWPQTNFHRQSRVWQRLFNNTANEGRYKPVLVWGSTHLFTASGETGVWKHAYTYRQQAEMESCSFELGALFSSQKGLSKFSKPKLIHSKTFFCLTKTKKSQQKFFLLKAGTRELLEILLKKLLWITEFVADFLSVEYL